MTIGDVLYAEMEHEGATARRLLERIPADKFGWKPHEKSMPMGQLAAHLGETFGWTPITLTTAELDFEKYEYKPFIPTTSEDLLENFDKNLAEALGVVRSTSDKTFMELWTMRSGEMIFFTLPKTVAMRSFVMNHMIHHRGQLSVYLRLNDIAVPSIYGPSADEGVM